MPGYITVPENIHCKQCRQCGARPVIEHVGPEGYVVKCPNADDHYKTVAGIIDIEDWNIHNTSIYDQDYDLKMLAGK